MVVYKIKNTLNGKVYIGRTIQSLNNRWTRHKYDCFVKELDFPLYRAMRKYGIENFTIEKVDEAETIEKLNKKEADWIFNLESMVYQNGYNIKPEDNRLKMPKETRLKISNSLKGKKKVNRISKKEKSKIAKENGSKATKNTNGLKKFHKENPNFNRDIAKKRMENLSVRENLSKKAKEQWSLKKNRDEMAKIKGSKKFQVIDRRTGEIAYEGYNQHECARLLNVSQRAVNKWVLGLNKSRNYLINNNL